MVGRSRSAIRDASDKFSFSFIGLEFFGVIVITRVCLEIYW